MARTLIENNQDIMHAMANALLELETLDADQIDDIMARRAPRAPIPTTPVESVDGQGKTPPPPVIHPESKQIAVDRGIKEK